MAVLAGVLITPKHVFTNVIEVKQSTLLILLARNARIL